MKKKNFEFERPGLIGSLIGRRPEWLVLGMVVLLAGLTWLGVRDRPRVEGADYAYHVVRIDGCEYVRYGNGPLVHKENCNNHNHLTPLP